MKLTIYQVDAFAEKLFQGNPAAIIPLEDWIDDELMQRIAILALVFPKTRLQVQHIAILFRTGVRN